MRLLAFIPAAFVLAAAGVGLVACVVVVRSGGRLRDYFFAPRESS